MDIEVTFEGTGSLEELLPWRAKYLDSLPASQEVFVEVQVPGSGGQRILHDGRMIGYALLRERTLIEFYLEEAYAVFGQTVFDQLLAHTGAERALVKSFDSLFFSSCVDRQKALRSVGLLVRDYVKRDLSLPEELRYTARPAQLRDLPRIEAVDQQVFTDRARLSFVIERNYMLLFERGDLLLGFGIMRVVVPGRPGVDIGIALDKPYRKHGYAPYFLQHMAEASLARGFVPIAGCAVDNKPVRATGERIGMFAKHRLLELQF
jgi:GNAT superfamily N-acetyltransferase